MTSMFKMSMFAAPISPVKDGKSGRIIRPATVYPYRDITLDELVKIIRESAKLKRKTEEVREPLLMGDKSRFSELKREMLPYVTPNGCFSYRRSDKLVKPSGLVVIDIDGLESREVAENMRQKLFDDAYLTPALCFISPSDRGVKAFVPYVRQPGMEAAESISTNIIDIMTYVEYVYGNGEEIDSRVDQSGKDIARSCFLCHDANALARI